MPGLILTKQINKFINLPVVKHHQSAGVTIALKNMSHGPGQQRLPQPPHAYRQRLRHVHPFHREPSRHPSRKPCCRYADGIKAAYHGGPGGRPRIHVGTQDAVFRNRTRCPSTKPAGRCSTPSAPEVGMPSIALSKPDAASHYLNCQVEHVEIAGMLGLGEFDDKRIDVKRVELT